MSFELSVKDEQLKLLASDISTNDLLQPFIKEIFLLETFVAGTSYINDRSVFNGLKPGDVLPLKRENNKFDEKAILVLSPTKKKIGYIPERDNPILSRLMDAGKKLNARITKYCPIDDSFIKIRINVFLIDY